MRQRLADYISETLVANGITQNFSVTGGGAMHLNDAFGHQRGMHTLYQHHEQACAMAAESYARIYNRPALVCVTSGPGGTNAITGVLGAWLDSIPMLVISGQVRRDNTAHWSGRRLRAMGDQEFEITRAVSCMTKYAELLLDPYRVRYALEKCIYLSQTGRPGPCWLDIPVDVQGCYIETEELRGFFRESYERGEDGWGNAEGKRHPHPETASSMQRYFTSEEEREEVLRGLSALENPQRLPEDREAAREELPIPPGEELREAASHILDKLKESRRPVFYTGNGIRIAGAEADFLKLKDRLQIPVVVGWNAPDIIPTEDPLYAGRPGGRGDRPGNLCVQNADCILSIGSRLNIRQVGYRFQSWAREAYVMLCDIDGEELWKPSIHVDFRIRSDAGDLIRALLSELDRRKLRRLFSGGEGILRRDALMLSHTESAERIASGGESERLDWRETTAFYRENYPTVLPEYLRIEGEDGEGANVYALVKILSELSEEGQITVVGNGSPCVAGGQAWLVKKDGRFISQDGVASMGYDLPAAIGACAASHGEDAEKWRENALKNPYWKGRKEQYPDYGKRDILLLTGDGSLQMNLQELQTIIHHRLPIKIFVINNGGYHSIRQTQRSFFGEPLVGIGVDSGLGGKSDLSFPDLEKLAKAYGYPFLRISDNSGLKEGLRELLSMEGPALCEIIVSRSQQFLPKSSAKKLPDGSLLSPPLEDMAPFLPEEELSKLMLIKTADS